jgi:hypothetical protein
MTNISKYVQLNDFLLLEYEFNKDQFNVTPLTNIGSLCISTNIGSFQYINTGADRAVTNNDFGLNSLPENPSRTTWYCYPPDISTNYSNYFAHCDSSTLVNVPSYALDTIKVHIISGYNFDDVAGFLLQIRAKNTGGNFVDLANFTWINQILEAGSNVINFSTNALYLANRFYDKYVQFRIPSIQVLGGDTVTPLGLALNIKQLSDVFITYSTIPNINVDTYLIQEQISVQLPVTSVADNFNCFIAESTGGDYIEFYATWNQIIIGEYMGDIESGKIRLFTSNNPNDNAMDFADTYGAGAVKWVIMHELEVYELIPGGTTLLTQKYVFTQEDNFMNANFFRPVLRNADIDSAYQIDYTCRLVNRMDGTQVIRKASFASTDPKKYGLQFDRLNVDNYIPYKVFNRIEGEAFVQNITSGTQQSKFVKVFYDTTTVGMNMNNEILPQGTGPLFLKRGDGAYLFHFQKIDTANGDQVNNVDLSGAYNYGLLFIMDDQSKLEISPTYSTNMNTVLGQLEFKIMEGQVSKLLQQTNNAYSIVVKNPDGSQYTFYEGVFFSYSNMDQVITQFNNLVNVSALNTQIASLQEQVKTLTDQNTALKAK